MTRPIHYITPDALEALARDGGYTIELGRDSAELTTREGTIFRARLTAVAK